MTNFTHGLSPSLSPVGNLPRVVSAAFYSDPADFAPFAAVPIAAVATCFMPGIHAPGAAAVHSFTGAV